LKQDSAIIKAGANVAAAMAMPNYQNTVVIDHTRLQKNGENEK